MDMGVYLSPWDAHSHSTMWIQRDQYNEYYLNQLKEILEDPKYGNKGKFVEVWMDGARGDGAQKVTYTFDKWFEAIRKAQGDIAIFSAEPTNVRWIGMKRGLLEIRFGKRSIQIRSATIHPIATSITGIRREAILSGRSRCLYSLRLVLP